MKSGFEAQRERLMGVFVFFLGVSARLAFLLWRGPEITPDSGSYFTLAENLKTHGIFSIDNAAPFAPSARFPPLYPSFLAALSWAGQPAPLAITIAQALLGALTAVMVFLIARALLNTQWAFIAALFYALHPGAIASASAILSETLFTALLVCAIWVLSGALRNDRLVLTVLAGLIMGLAILCRSVVLLLPLLLSGIIFFQQRSQRRFAHGLVLTVIALLVVTPWSVRSSRVTGRLVTVQDPNVVASLFYMATRWDRDQNLVCWACFREEARELETAARRERAADGQGQNEDLSRDKVLMTAGIRNIRAHPGKYLLSRARWFPHLFITSFDPFTQISRSYATLLSEHDLLRLGIKLSLLFTFSLAPFVLAIIGLASSWKNTTAMLCASVWLYILFVHLPLWVEMRYWWPAVPFLLISAGPGARRLGWGFVRWRNGRPQN